MVSIPVTVKCHNSFENRRYTLQMVWVWHLITSRRSWNIANNCERPYRRINCSWDEFRLPADGEVGVDPPATFTLPLLVVMSTTIFKNTRLSLYSRCGGVRIPSPYLTIFWPLTTPTPRCLSTTRVLNKLTNLQGSAKINRAIYFQFCISTTKQTSMMIYV